MCLYPELKVNRKYIPNKKNNYMPPEMKDPRVQFVPVGCGKCMECRKQKSNNWSVRLQEQIRTEKYKYFVTLTFSNEEFNKLAKEVENNIIDIEGYELDNAVATLAMRRYLERWRKKYSQSVKHWFITEIGKGKTTEIGRGNKWEKLKLQGDGNIHLHGIIFLKQEVNVIDYSTGEILETFSQQEQFNDIREIWQYGWVHIGKYCTERTVNYCVKYMTKTDENHKYYMPKILTSAGIGNNYTKRWDYQLNKFKANGETKETYTLRTGRELSLPIYYRNKIYNEDQREGLWLQKLDKQQRWVLGVKIDISKTDKYYYKALEEARAKNKRLGYGDNEKDWKRIEYEKKRRILNRKARGQAVELMDNPETG